MDKKVEDFFSLLDRDRKISDIKMMNSLKLAYIGDAVYELAVRLKISAEIERVSSLHKSAVGYVSASMQRRALEIVYEELTEEERAVFLRGRNQKAHDAPKSTDINTYRISTGYEALIGYLFLKKDYERLYYLIVKGMEEIK